MDRFKEWLVAAAVLAGMSRIVMAQAVDPSPTATSIPPACFALEPASAAAGEMVAVDGDCPGLLHHRFIRVYFDCTLVVERDFGGGTLFRLGFTVPRTAFPGMHSVTVVGPFLNTSTNLEITGEPIPCPGDCNLDHQVHIDELLTGAAIALERRPLTDCPVFDGDDDSQVAVEELISAVAAALHGCERATPCEATPNQP